VDGITRKHQFWPEIGNRNLSYNLRNGQEMEMDLFIDFHGPGPNSSHPKTLLLAFSKGFSSAKQRQNRFHFFQKAWMQAQSMKWNKVAQFYEPILSSVACRNKRQG